MTDLESLKPSTDEIKNKEIYKLDICDLKEEQKNVEIKGGKRVKVKEIFEWLIKYFVSLCLGFWFGYAMEKSKVYEPRAIRQQMIFQRFIMLKMFLSSLAISTFSVLLAALIFKKR